MKISGRIQSGVGKGAFFTQVDWVVRQCEEMLGYKPYPGTLNVQVCEKDLDNLDGFLASADCKLVPDDPVFCAARVKKVMINEIPAAVVLPSEDVRVHENRVIELIAACNLKETLGLDDGDTVTVSETERRSTMNTIYKDIYEFASSAGAFEGYVYQRENLDAAYLNNWVKNLIAQYREIPEDVRDSFQFSLDRTIGRAVRSLISAFGEDHEHVVSLKPLIVGKMPDAPDDFEEEKEEKSTKYGK